MNSFAHYSFGAVYQWMLENLGGIRTDTTAWKHVVIAPELDPQLTRVAASLNTIRGPVKTDWQRAGDTLKLTVTLPANTTGTVYLPFTPAAGPPDLTESGHPLASATGVTVQTMESNRAVLAITSGTYHFKVINHP
jgi:alpha-L-rhamnosidase